jgi:hypothetical protein
MQKKTFAYVKKIIKLLLLKKKLVSLSKGKWMSCTCNLKADKLILIYIDPLNTDSLIAILIKFNVSLDSTIYLERMHHCRST